MSFGPPNFQLIHRQIDAIGGKTVHLVATKVSAPFQIGCVPKLLGVILSAINLTKLSSTTLDKIQLNLSYCDSPLKRFDFPLKIFGLNIIYWDSLNTG